MEKAETDLERREMIKEKCFLRFPTLPFIPKEPYDVIATDYDNFSLVSGAKDRSFIQVWHKNSDPVGSRMILRYFGVQIGTDMIIPLLCNFLFLFLMMLKFE